MEEVSEGLKAACDVSKTTSAYLASGLTTADKLNFLPMWEWRKKNARDKMALQIELDEQKAEHDRRMQILDASTKQRIAYIEAQTQYSLEAIGEQIASGTPPSVAFTSDPFAVRATAQLYADTLNGQYAKERIALYAAKEAAEHPDRPVAEGKTSETFFANFWDYAKNIRDEEAMQVWGKLLAGEIQQPGKFSVRALDILRSLSTEEARLFEQFSLFVVDTYHSMFEISREEGFLNFYELSTLESLGIIKNDASIPIRNDELLNFTHFNACVTLKDVKEKKVKIKVLTPVGRELYSLVDITYEQSEKLFTLMKEKAEQQGIILTKIP